ncbi:DUF4153 domain-containing protein [Winslowiella iniecta]|nr:DUF4153 domain-containing protein [Winslowiella iniecta]
MWDHISHSLYCQHIGRRHKQEYDFRTLIPKITAIRINVFTRCAWHNKDCLMLATSPLTPTCRSGIIITGFLAGSSWATLMYFQTSALLLVLLSGFTGVLVFTVTRFRSPLPWLLALSVLPFLALITLWLDWNFRDDSSRFFIVDIMPVIVFWLFLILPFLQARNWKSGDNMATAVIASLWANSFTVIVATLLTGLFWLVMLLWSNLFGLIELRLFDRWFFYNDIFPPVATGVVIAASVALCRSLPAAGNIFKRVISLMAAVALPLHAAVSLIFLAVLPFTGLIIIPKNVSTVLLLTTMALAMMVMTAIVCSPTATVLRYPGWLRKLVVIAQWLMPLFAILAAWALWLRVAQYGWTMDRINAAAVIAVTLAWTVGTAWLQRRAWRDDSPKLDMLSTCVLGLMAILWLLLHSPALDPYRITINNQLSRLEQGLQQANPGDLYMFSIAGRRGHQALLTLQAHPQWLADPAELAWHPRIITDQPDPR